MTEPHLHWQVRLKPRAVYMTKEQVRRRRLAFRLDRFDVPNWLNWALCWLVGLGHTPIHEYGSVHCAWCNAKVSPDSPDTLPPGFLP